MRLQSPRGTEDRLPAVQPWWNFVESTAARIAHLYGYQRIDTPVIESTALFERGVGEATDIVDKEMYTFEDRGGDSLTLRPEGTAPICRAYIQHGMQALPQPVKLWYWISSFRYDRPQAGRYRQFHQFGFEAFGIESAEVDIEVIAMAMHFCRDLGLRDLKLVINSIGTADARRRYVESLRSYYEPFRNQLSPDSQRRLERNALRILDSKDPRDRPFAENAPRITDFLDSEDAAHFQQLQDGLRSLGVPFEVDPTLVRGLDYYVRTVFEIQPPDAGGQSTIGGGGRYDPLMEALGGPAVPGIGFAAGVERIIANLEKQGVQPPAAPSPAVYIAALGVKAITAGRQLAQSLREAGIPVVSALSDRSMKAQMRHAGTTGAAVTLILGDDEVANQVVTVRPMDGGSQVQVPLDRVVDHIRTLL